jgi:hypothetical protein
MKHGFFKPGPQPFKPAPLILKFHLGRELAISKTSLPKTSGKGKNK